jgi:dihydroorotate dehydrogenase (NAD+) catalytic subunit
VYQVYQEARRSNVAIIGQGGIETPHDALEFVLAGATTVGLGTALFYDPLAAQRVNAGIDEYLRKHRMKSLADLVGALERNDALDVPTSG